MAIEKQIQDLNYFYGLKGKFDEELQEDYSDGYVLDCMLEVLRDLNSTIREMVTNIDGDKLSDEEAIELIASLFNLERKKHKALMKFGKALDVEKTVVFNTEAELVAYLEGVADMDGWEDFDLEYLAD